jgi:hypothetical protein
MVARGLRFRVYVMTPFESWSLKQASRKVVPLNWGLEVTIERGIPRESFVGGDLVVEEETEVIFELKVSQLREEYTSQITEGFTLVRTVALSVGRSGVIIFGEG